MDNKGAEGARRFAESAAATFTIAIDRPHSLWNLYHFNFIPSGFFVDEQGIVRYAKIGEFDVRNPRDEQAVEKLLASHQKCPAVLSARGCEFFQSIDLGAWRAYPQ